ncbi:bifunctional 5,10-methylenetetrahydrofolate dehydrogenase/5,10-methenyltetrahydrofolate cyclohydrolase [Candidatus Solirubrobacter pratensis]|uniref:bifunctional 5,10-methylenetetrahydrofolate dehydrogenase/5,10-methenyltetrahydrofolate cyclohydrolase n=1 Tax=Candidatus Solirubrobacter pratensis TaxID=1298857 RepID=UPI0004161159|nr:bifunctional 5,10-methylenetetrahydrofolate dehydrogenase/5,10-methenyltetrahydrofolate cyclohydrolase [Candidatus Solirubrobacter pratensis]
MTTSSPLAAAPEGVGVLTFGSPATPATLIDGAALAAAERAAVAADAASFLFRHGRRPGLATVLAGEDAASRVYVASKHRACEEAGVESFRHELSADASRAEVLGLIDDLNADPAVDGILCQLPVPRHLDGADIAARVAPGKDVDGLSPASAGALALGLPGLRPCTPLGVMRLLESTGRRLRGLNATVVGASDLVGKPVGQLLLQAGATVTQCHIDTRDVAGACRTADVLIVAAGVPGLVRGDWIKPGAIVIDVGINRLASGLVGDVAFHEATEVAGWITPVPGGVGPMTIAMLLQNTLQAAWGLT